VSKRKVQSGRFVEVRIGGKACSRRSFSRSLVSQSSASPRLELIILLSTVKGNSSPNLPPCPASALSASITDDDDDRLLLLAENCLTAVFLSPETMQPIKTHQSPSKPIKAHQSPSKPTKAHQSPSRSRQSLIQVPS